MTDQLILDHERFRSGLPQELERYVLETYGLDLASTYGGQSIRNPFGKASGQLSLTAAQIEKDVEAGLGFVVLKTVIAVDSSGEQSMKAWAIPETRMRVERIEARRPEALGQSGWTTTWKGRGWSDSFAEYLEFFRNALRIADTRTLVVPSVKYHLPGLDETQWRVEEYTYTTKSLLDVWNDLRDDIMPIEKDFSPTLAGDAHFSSVQENILTWLRTVPRLIRTAGGERLAVGLKLFNATFDDAFQLRMLAECITGLSDAKADYLILLNRLFDPAREFEGKKGVAYGGPDLSARNLAVLDAYASWSDTLPYSATGNIHSGRVAWEYLRRGASSFQMHTVFQLPLTEYAMTHGSRTERALHKLLFDPKDGFIACWLEVRERFELRASIEQLARELRS